MLRHGKAFKGLLDRYFNKGFISFQKDFYNSPEPLKR